MMRCTHKYGPIGPIHTSLVHISTAPSGSIQTRAQHRTRLSIWSLSTANTRYTRHMVSRTHSLRYIHLSHEHSTRVHTLAHIRALSHSKSLSKIITQIVTSVSIWVSDLFKWLPPLLKSNTKYQPFKQIELSWSFEHLGWFHFSSGLHSYEPCACSLSHLCANSLPTLY